MTATDGASALAPTPFDPADPLPVGTTLLEASAGTGKTYTISGLAARYVGEGHVALRDLLVVTFGRAATSEMRERVRDRLSLAADGLRRGVPTDDPYIRVLGEADPAEVSNRAGRLRRAVSEFDSATIATTHQFCHQVLWGLGMSAGVDDREQFAAAPADAIEEVIVDLYLRDIARYPDLSARLSFGTADKVARAAIEDPHAQLGPGAEPEHSEAALRVGFATAARDEVARRRRRRLEMDYDDLLVRVRDALADPVTGAGAATRLRERYRVVLVDEFQDTDPVQWEILRRAFHDQVPLILIGDPKQAIYAFRGGDLHTYLEAASSATSRRTLTVNWRADPAVVSGVRHLLRGAALGDERISVHPVVPGRSGQRVSGPSAPVRVRVLTRDDGPLARGSDLLTAAGGREAVAADVGAVAVDLLGPDYRRSDGRGDRPLEPGDLAVLVRTHVQADLVRASLRRRGLPVVLSGTRSVFGTTAARHWTTLLQALEEPHRQGLARAAALTMLVGTTPAELLEIAQTGDGRIGSTFRTWQTAWFDRGVPALLEEVEAAGLAERLLGTPDGERELTDVRHVAEALHEQTLNERLGPTAQREWLQRQAAEARDGSGAVSEERSRRLESDSAAVQVMTVHAAKGLEFPVVLVPFGWDRWVDSNPATLLLHDDGQRLRDVGGKDAPSYAANRMRSREEELGEDLRACYVALTRAASHLVLWWAPSSNTEHSPVHRLLFGDFDPGQVPPSKLSVPTDRDVYQRMQELRTSSDGSVHVERATPSDTSHWPGTAHTTPALGAARFDRAVDLDWRRLSYTAITAVAHGIDAADARSEPESVGTTDEPESAGATPSACTGVSAPPSDSEEQQGLRELVSPWSDLPAGAAFGTMVHEALESLDTGAADLAGEAQRVSVSAIQRRPGTTADAATLAAALQASLATPLGPLAGGARLQDISPSDRLPELDFELPLAGGDREVRRRATLTELTGLMREHLPSDDPLVDYPDRLLADGLGSRVLGGYLVGSIDAVLRVRDPQGYPRFLVVDYKTNRVRTDETALTAWHYRPERLVPVMIDAHYPLQALLYCVALHRFLRWRQPGYDPGGHLGGVQYLFLRGMVGPKGVDADGQSCGVFSWQPPAELVVSVSDLLAGGPR